MASIKGAEGTNGQEYCKKNLAISIVILFLVSASSLMVFESPNQGHNEFFISGSSDYDSKLNVGLSMNPGMRIYTPVNDILNEQNSNGFNETTLENLTSNASYNYSEKTLVLLNNTLMNGDFVNSIYGIYPNWIAYDAASNTIYVTNKGSNNVLMISGSTNRVIGAISVTPYGAEPVGIAYDPLNDNIYVADTWSDTATNPGVNNVTVISGSTNQAIDNIQIGYVEPWGVTYDNASNTIYVSNLRSNFVTAISGATNNIIGNITVGSAPLGIAYDPTSNTIYVANTLSNNITVISGSTN